MTAGHLAVLIGAGVPLTVMLVTAGLCFKAQGKTPRGLTVVKILGLVSVAAVGWALWVAAPPSGAETGLSVALFGVALILYAWALWTHRGRWPTRVYCDDVPAHLVVTGPYRLVRHPCYGAYVLLYTGALVAGRSPWLVVVLLANAALYWHAARREERKFASSALAADYEAYRRRTGMLLPNPVKMLRRKS